MHSLLTVSKKCWKLLDISGTKLVTTAQWPEEVGLIQPAEAIVWADSEPVGQGGDPHPLGSLL